MVLFLNLKYRAEFSEKEFDALKKGSSQSKVLNLLGEPTEQNTNRNGTIDWYYGTDGAAAFGDFAWVQYSIFLSNQELL